MTEEEYKNFEELEKKGQAKEIYLDAYDEARKEADAYLRIRDVQDAASKNGKPSGQNAPLVEGLDWAGFYSKVNDAKEAPTEEQMDAFRGKVGEIVTGLKFDKDGNEFFDRGDPDDLYNLAVKAELFPSDPVAKPLFGQFLRDGNITEEEAKKKVESGEWDETDFSGWLRAKSFADIRNDARDFAQKRSARNTAERYTEEHPVKSALAEFFLPSTMRTLREGETPTRLQIGSDAAVSALAFMPGVGAVARTPSALASALRVTPAMKSAGIVEKVSALLMPSLAGALTGANEYIFNDEDMGTAAKDAARNALVGLGGGAVNELGTLAVMQATPGLSRVSGMLSRLLRVGGDEMNVIRQKADLSEAVGKMNKFLSKAAKKRGKEFVEIPEDATGESIHNAIRSVYGTEKMDITDAADFLNSLKGNAWEDDFQKVIAGMDPENLRDFSKTVVNYDLDHNLPRADDINTAYGSADPEERYRALSQGRALRTQERVAGKGRGGRIWKMVSKAPPAASRAVTAGLRATYVDSTPGEFLTKGYDPKEVATEEQAEALRKEGKFSARDLSVGNPSPSIHDFYMEQLGKMMRQ